MSLEAAASFATLFVIAATAVAALMKIKHLRESNPLTGLLNVLNRAEDPIFNEYIDKSKALLAEKLSQPEYRRELSIGRFERQNNPWLNLMNS